MDLDDRLRIVPGFTLFRRTSSLVANPTTQGVSLRGIGSTGASRSLVLWDGFPVNDPFGGWLYWDRFPPEEMDRVEISRGASTSVFGDLAMGGAIALFSRPAERDHFDLGYTGGNENSHELFGGASDIWSHFAVSGYLRGFTTDGYYIVPQPIRGPVDRPANVQFGAGNIRLDYFTSTDRLFVRLDVLAEDRGNGTVLTSNSTGFGSIGINYAHTWANDEFSILAYHTDEQFHATFSAVNAARTFESLTYSQTVPADADGGAALWRHSASAWHFVAGGDEEYEHGVSTDHLRPTGLRIGGGSQSEEGIFGQADAQFGPAQFFLGAREQFSRGDHTFFTPNAGLALGHKSWRFRGSVYRGFRAPTLNELYRVFRVGNTITEANSGLLPETMFGSEFGIDYVGERTHVSVTLYRNSLTDLITNVTLQTGPTIIRQRQNAAGALARGVEGNIRETLGHWGGTWTANLNYLLADSRYDTGPRLPEVPRNQGTALLTYQRSGTLASVGVRAYSLQFDDDLNQYLLPGFTTVQLSLTQRLSRTVSAHGEVENLLGRQYLVAKTPTPNTGTPQLWRIGLRWQR